MGKEPCDDEFDGKHRGRLKEGPLEKEKLHLFGSVTQLARRGRSMAKRVLGIAGARARVRFFPAEATSRSDFMEHDGPKQPSPSEPPSSATRTVTSPFDPRQAPAPTREPRAAEHIPWSYGQDRVTAIDVDPNRMLVYWEISDPAIERAREGLGAGGPEAWLSLRIYDVTGRIFDGTNAHGYFDVKVERSDRQWVVEVGKPTSTAIVELGVKSLEGYFVKMVRSGRLDFPRDHSAPPAPTEWLTVHAVGGVGSPRVLVPEGRHPALTNGSAASPGLATRERVHAQDAFPLFDPQHVYLREAFPEFERRWTWFGWQLPEVLRREWVESLQSFWESGVLDAGVSWESGPFTTAFGPMSLSVEYQSGGAIRVEHVDGKARVVHGPWQVIVRGIDAKGAQRVVGRWQMQRTVVLEGGYERIDAGAFTGAGVAGEVSLGGSAWLGASERRWLAASEIRLEGASEMYFLGASELRYGGASEFVFAGATERRFRGASELATRGASEWRLGGGSEGRLGGASERALGGASEAYR